jgi:hypothetical protein
LASQQVGVCAASTAAGSRQPALFALAAAVVVVVVVVAATAAVSTRAHADGVELARAEARAYHLI